MEKRSIHPPQAQRYAIKEKIICTLHAGTAAAGAGIRRAFSNSEENFAARFVRLLGCEVISRNSRRHGAEIDLLCKHRQSRDYFFFEVKKNPKAENRVFSPVSRAQLQRLKKAARQLQQSADRLLTIRVCLLLVDLKCGRIELLTDVITAR